MGTILKFNVNAGDSKALSGVAVKESPVEVQNQWETASARYGLMHLTHLATGAAIHVNRDTVAYWRERPTK
jgi:hypothetical protein